MCCMLCKAKGKSVDACLLKMKPSTPSNGTKHLNDVHPKEFAEAKKDKEESKSKKRTSSTPLTSAKSISNR